MADTEPMKMKTIAEQWAEVESLLLVPDMTACQRQDIWLGFYLGVQSLIRQQSLARNNGATDDQHARTTSAWIYELDTFWEQIHG